MLCMRRMRTRTQSRMRLCSYGWREVVILRAIQLPGIGEVEEITSRSVPIEIG